MTTVTAAVVIADSTCLIGLSKISRLELLPALFGRITLAPAVWHEVVVQGQGRSGSAEIQNANWIDVTEVRDMQAVDVLRQELGAGESQSMVLALTPRLPIRCFACAPVIFNMYSSIAILPGG